MKLAESKSQRTNINEEIGASTGLQKRKRRRRRSAKPPPCNSAASSIFLGPLSRNERTTHIRGSGVFCRTKPAYVRNVQTEGISVLYCTTTQSQVSSLIYTKSSLKEGVHVFIGLRRIPFQAIKMRQVFLFNSSFTVTTGICRSWLPRVWV
jgi:hypothetical protein